MCRTLEKDFITADESCVNCYKLFVRCKLVSRFFINIMGLLLLISYYADIQSISRRLTDSIVATKFYTRLLRFENSNIPRYS